MWPRRGCNRHVDWGRWGERRVRRYLRLRGYRILEQNYRCHAGEVDLIARRGKTLAFVEVKTRRSSAHGGPLEAVTATKRRRLRQAAAAYLVGKAPPPVCRFDVAALRVHPLTGRVSLEYVAGAFSEDD